jgi:hypothetical protein
MSMSSLTPPPGPQSPTETLTVELAAIRQDASWPVDPALVASFRASIRRGEPPLLDLSLNRLRLADGASGLEIIDGMQRLEALRLEGVTTHSAKVRAYSPQDAFYARIATSIGKPNELFRQRAERALREGFVQDVATHLEGATLYQRGVAEDGTPRPTPRREPLPADPLLALGTVLWVHFAAKPEVTEDWERYVLTWLEDIATRLGKTPAWLRDEVLQIAALLGTICRGTWGSQGNRRRSGHASCSPFPTMGFCGWHWRASRPSPSSPRLICGSPSTCWGVDQTWVDIAGSNRGVSQRCEVSWRMPRSRSWRATIPPPSRARKRRPVPSRQQYLRRRRSTPRLRRLQCRTFHHRASYQWPTARRPRSSLGAKGL